MKTEKSFVLSNTNPLRWASRWHLRVFCLAGKVSREPSPTVPLTLYAKIFAAFHFSTFQHSRKILLNKSRISYMIKRQGDGV